MKNILITGATGFLGWQLIKECLRKNHKPVAIGHSELRAVKTAKSFPDLPIYCLDISTHKDQIKKIIDKHDIEYIIHSAALKHVSVCETNPSRATEINVIGSKNIIEASLQKEIKNAIAVSTDKAINPINVYGTTKYIMERMFLENNYSVYRGVNFLFSSGSCLDIWNSQIAHGEPITINKKNSIRFFIDAGSIASKIIDNLDLHNEIIYPDECYKINLHDLADSFCQATGFNKKTYVQYDDNSEKIIEEIPTSLINIKEPSKQAIIELLKTKIPASLNYGFHPLANLKFKKTEIDSKT